MDIVIIAVCCVIVVELLLYTRFVSAVRDIKLVYNKTTYVLGSKAISDHWKEKALKKYAGNIFLITLRILLKLVIIFSPFIAAILIAEHTSSQIDRIIYTPWGIIGTTVFAAGYGIVRKNISKSDYGFFDRLLHHFALGIPHVQEMSFDIDQFFSKADSERSKDKMHVFVAGLARAGTTALMRLFYETGSFCSLTYRDMPFPLAPYTFKKLFNLSAKQGRLTERAHGDGILVDFDSPEALEEVFWRVFCAKQYIYSDKLVPMNADPEVIKTFRKYISGLLLSNNSDKYLSKNNNNILRLTSIQKAFPNAVILIPFRDPLQQSLSLWHQHLKFVEEHKKNKFAKSYMTWLVHHEFGEDHRFFDVASRKSSKSLDDPGYWLDQWIHVYGYLLRVAYENKLNLIFINYEELCDYPDIVWKSLSSLSGIDSDILPGGFTLNKAPQRSWRSYEGTNEQEARDIYDELTSKFKKAIQEPLR